MITFYNNEIYAIGTYNNRGRNAPFGAPPAQIPASAIHALGSHLGCLTSKRASGQG